MKLYTFFYFFIVFVNLLKGRDIFPPRWAGVIRSKRHLLRVLDLGGVGWSSGGRERCTHIVHMCTCGMESGIQCHQKTKMGAPKTKARIHTHIHTDRCQCIYTNR